MKTQTLSRYLVSRLVVCHVKDVIVTLGHRYLCNSIVDHLSIHDVIYQLPSRLTVTTMVDESLNKQRTENVDNMSVLPQPNINQF